jgi:transcriptional antiterminator NusG
MRPEEIRKMRLEEPVVSEDAFAVGDNVSIIDGPLKGFFGTVKAINPSAQKATVSTTMFGRETDVEVEYVQIEKLDGPIPEQPEEEA